MSLENKAAMAKPSLVNDNALVFGTARILGKDNSGAIRFFETRLNTVRPDLRSWVRWYYGFTLMLDRQFGKSAKEFAMLAKSCKDGIITGLSAYFLGTIIQKSISEPAVVDSAITEGRERVLKTYPSKENWDRETAKINTEIHTAVLSTDLEKAGQWLYRGK